MWWLRSFGNAWHGFMLAIRTQRNMRIHVVAAIVVFAVGFYFSFSATEWCLIIVAIGLVMGLEVVNTSIEELVNFVSPEKREEARRIKDLAAGAVLIGAISALAVGIVLLFSKIF